MASNPRPPTPRLAVLVDATLGHLQQIGDDAEFRHGGEWRRWLAGRIDLFQPGTTAPSSKQVVVVVNHWPSRTGGRQDTMSHRELLAWEVGRWMCSTDTNSRQVQKDGRGRPVPVCRQPSVAMGDFNCEPGSPELRSKRRFSLQAMRTEPRLWGLPDPDQGKQALLYDLAWRKLAADPASTLGSVHWLLRVLTG